MAPAPRTEKARFRSLPQRAGVGLKLEHVRTILDEAADVGFFEVHPENYMGAGGPPHHYLTRIRELYPLSLHGVGLSIGAARPLDRGHLARLRGLAERYEPQSFSEHLAWSTHDTVYMNDLLPLPYTEETLACVAGHVEEVQEALGRTILIENPSTYVAFTQPEMTEIEFLTALAACTGCGLLLDVNNVFVSATNHNFDPETYIDAFPLHLVGEIHLAGHAAETDDAGAPLLIDSHDREVADPVWALYERALRTGGPKPTLVEWDSDLPDWPVLASEAKRAEAVIFAAAPPERRRAAG